ncbi:MAG: DUF2461 domain-containing protein [Cyclobacteriaceae bacterium]
MKNNSSSTIDESTFEFLKRLSRNNNRDWFNSRKDQYLSAKESVESFVDSLIEKMNTHDQIEVVSGRKSLYRIYNDVRFSPDKKPYNPRFAGYIKRTKPLNRGGYYFWIAPGKSRVACGFGHPNSEDLKRMRQDISGNYDEWRRILKSKKLLNTFGAMHGDQVKTAPQGFPKDHPAIDLLRFKQYWFVREFTDNEVLSPRFATQVNNTFKTIRPFFDHASEVLTTDLNGEQIVF